MRFQADMNFSGWWWGTIFNIVYLGTYWPSSLLKFTIWGLLVVTVLRATNGLRKALEAI